MQNHSACLDAPSGIQPFNIAFELPEHATAEPVQLLPGQKITCELSFLHASTSGVITSMTNIPLPMQYDPQSLAYFGQQHLYCQFSVSSPMVNIEFSLAMPGVGQKKQKLRGQCRISDIYSMAIKSAGRPSCIQVKVPGF